MNDDLKVGRVVFNSGPTGTEGTDFLRLSGTFTSHASWCPKMTAAGDPQCICNPEAKERYNAGLEAAAGLCDLQGQRESAANIRALKRT